jgi:ATP-binding cassette, subfamily A (ABC1), member 3
MTGIPGSRMADDVATRFEIPILRDASGNTGVLSLPQLFNMLTANRDSADDIEFTVEKGALESVFLKIIRENNVCEEDVTVRRKWWRF